MAINFLNKVDFNKNELDHARIVNEAGNTAAGTGVTGQLYFDTTADSGVGVLKVWTNQWVEVGGGVESLTTTQAGNSTGDSITLLSSAIGPVTVNAFAYAGAGNVGYVPSGGTNTKFLRGDGTWVVPTDTGITGVTLATGTSGGAPLTESITNRELTLTSMAYNGGTNIGYVPTGGSVTTFLRGDGTWVVPTNDLYTLGKAAASNDLILKNDGVDQDTIVFNGTAKEIKLDVATADNYTFSLADGAFAAWGTAGTNLQLPEHATAKTPASGDDSTRIATTAFVQAAVTGLLEFKGGFNANTGDLDSPLTTDLYTDTIINVGDYYVVTTAGDFFGNAATPLTPGDSVIAQNAVPDPSTTPAVEADFIVVQSDTDLATLSTVGLGNVNADTDDSKLGISVSYLSGTAKTGVDLVGLDPGGAVDNSDVIFGNNGTKNVKFNIGNIIAKSSVQLLLDTPNVTGVSNQSSPPAGTQGWVINSNTVLEAAALDCGVEVMTAAGQTVYADISRSGNNITINFTAPSAITQGTYRAIVTRG